MNKYQMRSEEEMSDEEWRRNVRVLKSADDRLIKDGVCVRACVCVCVLKRN